MTWLAKALQSGGAAVSAASPRRFVTAFGILLGLTAGVDALWLILRLFLPSWGPVGPWLPEDLWAGLLYQFLSDVADWLPSLGLSALLLTCSYWLRPEELPKGETEALSRSSFLAMAASVAFAVRGAAGASHVGGRPARRADVPLQTGASARGRVPVAEKQGRGQPDRIGPRRHAPAF